MDAKALPMLQNFRRKNYNQFFVFSISSRIVSLDSYQRAMTIGQSDFILKRNFKNRADLFQNPRSTASVLSVQTPTKLSLQTNDAIKHF